MIHLIEKFFNLLTKIGLLHQGVTAKGLAFLFIIADIISLVLLFIFIVGFFLSKNKLVKVCFSVFALLFLVFILAQVVGYIDMAFIEPNWIKIEYVNLRIPRLAKPLKGIKIVYFSDLHVNKFGFREKSLIRIVDSLKPDIIFFTGGFTGEDAQNLSDAIPDSANVFRALKAKIGVWAVPDHTDDYIFNEDPNAKKQIIETGINLLYNESKKIYTNSGDYFWLVGVEDSFYGKNGLNEAMFKVPVNEPKIIITHSPNLIDNASEYGIDLVLVGKTHGGQIGVKPLRDLSEYLRGFKYIAGLYKVKDSYLYVNRGIGGKTSSYRVLCRPEVTVIEINNE